MRTSGQGPLFQSWRGAGEVGRVPHSPSVTALLISKARPSSHHTRQGSDQVATLDLKARDQALLCPAGQSWVRAEQAPSSPCQHLWVSGTVLSLCRASVRQGPGNKSTVTLVFKSICQVVIRL
jgi:hypothetical protein